MELLKELHLTHPWTTWCISTVVAVMVWQLAILLTGRFLRHQWPHRLVQIWTIGIVGTLVLPALRLAVSPLHGGAITWISSDTGRDGTWFSAPPGVASNDASGVSSLQTLPADEASALAWGLLLFGIGGTVILVKLVVSAVRVHRIVSRAVPCRGSPFVDPGIQVVVSGEVNVPFAAGIINRVIVLPEDAMNKPFSELEACLIHETTHVKRRDVLRHVLCRIATAVSWYSPFAWWIEGQLRLDSERVCDGEVVRSGVARQDYIRQIVALASGSILKRTVEPGWIPSLKTSHVMLRVESLCAPITTRAEVGQRVSPVLLGCGVLLIVLLSRATFPAPEFGFVLLPDASEAVIRP